MPSSFVTGVGDSIAIQPQPPAPATGTILWTADIPAGEKWTLHNLLLNWGVPDSAAGKLVFHIFVTVGGVTLSPFWKYAWLQSQHPEWWQAQDFALHMPIYGPATVSAVAVNVSGMPQPLYWSAIWGKE